DRGGWPRLASLSVSCTLPAATCELLHHEQETDIRHLAVRRGDAHRRDRTGHDLQRFGDHRHAGVPRGWRVLLPDEAVRGADRGWSVDARADASRPGDPRRPPAHLSRARARGDRVDHRALSVADQRYT